MNRRRFIKWSGLGLVASVFGGLAFANTGRGNHYYSGPPSDHFDGTVFFNPGGMPPGNFASLMRWQLGGGKKIWPDTYPSPHSGTKPDTRVEGAALHVTLVGHATMLIQTAGLNLLTDPIWSKRASPVSFAGPTRVNEPGIAFDDLPPIDVVLVTHNHYDHLDAATLERLTDAHDPLVLTPLGNDTIIKDAAPAMRVTPGDWGDSFEVGNGVTIHFEPCHHWSARGTRDRRMALWAAFVIETPGGNIYHVGDTGFHEGRNYGAAAEKHGPFRLATLPVGAYEPRWFMKGQHQNPDEAVQGFKASKARYAAGHHWGTFKLTNEGIEDPLDALAVALNDHDVDAGAFRALQPGERWDVPAINNS